jgi:hypothetical protein
MERTRTRWSFTAVAAVLSLSPLGVALADQPEAPAVADEPGHPMYDPATVETLQGEVVEMKRVVPRMKRMAKRFGHGVHAMLRTDKETIEVHLGPAPFVDQQEPKLAAKDRVEVKGSRVTIDGKPVILAEQVRKGEQVLTLRAPDGTPRWRGQGHHDGHGHDGHGHDGHGRDGHGHDGHGHDGPAAR